MKRKKERKERKERGKERDEEERRSTKKVRDQDNCLGKEKASPVKKKKKNSNQETSFVWQYGLYVME
jgi:hypothetical protein